MDPRAIHWLISSFVKLISSILILCFYFVPRFIHGFFCCNTHWIDQGHSYLAFFKEEKDMRTSCYNCFSSLVCKLSGYLNNLSCRRPRGDSSLYAFSPKNCLHYLFLFAFNGIDFVKVINDLPGIWQMVTGGLYAAIVIPLLFILIFFGIML